MRYGALNADGVHVRSGPGTIYESLAQLDTGTPVTITGHCDHWYRVDVASWQGAFIDDSLITILEERSEAAPPVTGTINADEVKLRTGPDREYAIVKVLDSGEPLTIYGRCGNWQYVCSAAYGKGYVWYEYVSIDPAKPIEEPVCICESGCHGDTVNENCPVCAANPDDCAKQYAAAGFPKAARVSVDQCEAFVGAVPLHLALATELTLYYEENGAYVFSADEIERGRIEKTFVSLTEGEAPACVCDSPCTADALNESCPVCAASGWGACAVKTLSEQTLSKVADDGATVSISGMLPVGAVASVTVVPVEAAAEFVAEGAQILFAYDIKILVAGVEWQPDESVRVSITPPAETPIASEVVVTHVAEDKATGETTPQPVTEVTTTESGAVEFAADGFSVYIISIINTTHATHTVIFPVGEFKVEYSIIDSVPFLPLSLPTITVGGPPGDSSAMFYDALYFKVTPTEGFRVTGVTADGIAIEPAGGVYTLNVSGAEAETVIGITVTGVKITGIPAQGQMLTSVVSSDSSGTFTYIWKSSGSSDGPFSDISGASGGTFTLPNDTTYDNKYIKVVATDGTESYTSAPVGPVAADVNITFDISQGSVKIGEGGEYRGYNSSGNLVSGTHNEGNSYTVTGTTGTADEGGNVNVTLSGKGNFNVILSNVTIYTGTPGGSYVGDGICAPISTGNVVGSGDINITLDGTNKLENVSDNPSDSYAALEKAYSDSTLIINGLGTLNAIGGADSAGIGSSDEIGGGTKNITINGGTIVARTRASEGAGIGSGNNQPAENIRIYGGNITATGVSNGAGIGGSGSGTHIAALGQVFIYGGTINATSSGTGAGIGGGGTGTGVTATGGSGEVHIYGGTITADSIGGGSGSQSGGDAIINISGGKVTVSVDGNIGGGSSTSSTGGSVKVRITGGTIVTPHISGGHSGVSNTYRDAEVFIKAASVNIGDRTNITTITGPDPTSEMETVVYNQIIDVDSIEGFTNTGTVTISNATLDDSSTHELVDVYPDSEGKVYFWLPVGYDVTSLTIDGTSYPIAGAQVQTATITHDSSTVGTVLGAVLNYGTATNYEWQISSDNTVFTPIAGASGVDRTSYTVVGADLDKYIRVKITAAENDVYSGSLLITATPHAGVYYDSLIAPTTLRAQLLNGSGGVYTYQWQMYNATSKEYDDIAGETGDTLSADAEYTDKRVRVRITDGATTYTTSFVVIQAPQLSFAVPLYTTITVSGDGTCTASADSTSIDNSSAVDVYVTNVALAWDTTAADAYFGDYTKVEAVLTLNGHAFPLVKGASPDAILPTSTQGVIGKKVGDTPESIGVGWAFSLGENNYIKSAAAAGVTTRVASITYTIGYLPPS